MRGCARTNGQLADFQTQKQDTCCGVRQNVGNESYFDAVAVAAGAADVGFKATFAKPEMPTMIAANVIPIPCHSLELARIPAKAFDLPTSAEEMKKTPKASRIFVPIKA